MSSLLTDRTALALWQELVRDAQQPIAVQLDETLESYLVFTLMQRQQDVALGGSVLALELLRCKEQRGAAGDESLRTLGDRCLLLSGLYPEQALKRNVQLRYFVDMGVLAYDSLASRAGKALGELYAALAEAFAVLVRVLAQLRKQHAPLQPLLAHELARLAGARQDPGFAGAVLLDPAARLQ